MMPINNSIQSEAEMVKVLASALKQKFNTDVSVQEFAGGYGIADLVFAKNFVAETNILDRTPINNYYALKSYLKLSSKTSFSVDDIIKLSGTSKGISEKVISYLLKENYIYKDGKHYCKSNVQFKNPIKKLVAIEAKLKDWKQGILQARRYKSFTDECYLAILARYEKNIDYTYLDKFGIGLILFNEKNGEIWIKQKPSKNILLSFYEDLMGIFAKELFLHQSNLVNNQNLSKISFQV
ncbi:MAG: hypothetical protein Q7K55_01350 [Candidatus Levybacteria bacterium]|nr:hypothetical protein [Candidatus Levybacteria bacterium]